MRWLFVDPKNSEEVQLREQTNRRILEWWRAFEARASDIAGLFERRANWDLPAWMHDHLHAIDERLMWEYGPAIGKREGHRLVITPETHHQLRPMVKSMLDQAPNLAGWEFYGARLPDHPEQALASVAPRTGIVVKSGAVAISMGQHRRVDLRFELDAASAGKDPTGAAFVLVECLLGEETLNKWIGEITTSRPKRGMFGFGRPKASSADCVSLTRLRPTVDSLIASVRDQMRSEPMHELDLENVQHSLYQSTPTDESSAQSDVFVGVTMYPEMLQASRDPLFCSERFSRCGETFAFVKTDLNEVPDDKRLDYRTMLEESITATLKPARLGCAIGAALGTRYGYVNLALSNLQGGIMQIRALLKEMNVARSSWIMFFDAELAAEWIGIYDDTPAPALPNDVA